MVVRTSKWWLRHILIEPTCDPYFQVCFVETSTGVGIYMRVQV